MQIKKLEWSSDSQSTFYTSNKLYVVYLGINCIVVQFNVTREILDRADDFDSAFKICEDHYSEFILSQIEEVKDFDPTLLGFELNQEFELDKDVFRIFEFKDNKNILLQLKNNKVWAMWEDGNKNHSVMPFYHGFFQEVKIPSHDFGVTLISQFLEVE